ncbi:MAG TPA: hypothetical protein IAB06_01670 [Candidatus Avacidaminococcus intestinavium]|uniref:Uncharacterized protein n=1 Tax=Candidatus Avacidaminococcus intestinavium TaxID=2840684 RepID=A0A9D1MP68_9FIRM|nr:hypothetical protein [Candidatus Avacidaminococcus intestinavium]
MVTNFLRFKIFKTDLMLALLTIVICGLSFLFAPSIAYENGPIENLQAIILAIGMLVTLALAKKSKNRAEQKLWLAGAILFFIAFWRELSWGRVFYPIKILNSFAPLEQLWYGKFVYPLLAFLIIYVLYLFYRYSLSGFLAKYKLPLWHFLSIVLLMILAQIAESGSFTISSSHYSGEILEELLELAAYSYMLDTIFIMVGKHE